MSQKGGYASKLIQKEKVRVLRKVHGTFKPMISRTKSTFAEKQVALRNHKMLVHGFEIEKRVDGVVVGLIVNRGACVTRPVYDGTGLPNEGYDFGEATKEPKAPAKKSDGVMVKTFVQPTAKVWSRRNGFAGK